MTEKKIVEILKKYGVNRDLLDETIERLASELFVLHEAEIAKLQEHLDIQIDVNDKLLFKLREAQAGIEKRDTIIEALEELLKYNNQHLPYCNRKQDWTGALEALSLCPEGIDKIEAYEDLYKKIQTCTCGLNQKEEKLLSLKKQIE